MPADDTLTEIGDGITERRAEYRAKLQSCFHFGKDGTARLRAAQCDTLLQIIAAAQVELTADFRPADTTAQIDAVVQACNDTSTFSSALATVATRLKTRLRTHRFMPRRAAVLAAQSAAWNAQRSVVDVIITDHNNAVASKVDSQFAIQSLGADGLYHPPPMPDGEFVGTAQARAREAARRANEDLQLTLQDDMSISSCHPTAEALQAILGQANGYFETAGGAGPARRAEAIALALVALGVNTRARVIWLQCTASSDGHSFTLVTKPSGRVDVLEAWANPGGNGYLRELRGQLKHNLTRDVAVEAVTRLIDPDSGTRDLGYRALSTAYPRDTSRHFEENRHGARDADGNISILCTVRDLADYPTVQGRMQARYQLIAGYHRDLRIPVV